MVTSKLESHDAPATITLPWAVNFNPNLTSISSGWVAFVAKCLIVFTVDSATAMIDSCTRSKAPTIAPCARSCFAEVGSEPATGVTTICGIDSVDVLHQNVAIARGFKPMSPQEMQALRERCRPSSGDGHLELFKTTKKYDGRVGREQHGYPSIAELPL